MTHLRNQHSLLRAGLFAHQQLRPLLNKPKSIKSLDDIPLLTIRAKPFISRGYQVRLWIFPAVAFALLLVLVDARANVNQQSDWEAISAGELWLTSGQQRIPAELTQVSEIEVNVSGLLAKVRITQTFTNPSDDWVEGEYLFPLPEKSAVHHFEIHVGERKIVGIVKEKEAAQRIYIQTKAAGKKAGMLTQQRTNLFTSNVANIGPQEAVSVIIEYIEQVDFDHGVFSLRIPTTLTPRYLVNTSAQEQGSKERDSIAQNKQDLDPQVEIPEQPILLNDDGWQGSNTDITRAFDLSGSGGRFSLEASIDMHMTLAKVESLYHNIRLKRNNTEYHFSLANGMETMNRDVVLQWQAVNGAIPQAGLFMEQLDGEDYGF